MGYMENLEREFTDKMETADRESLIRFFKEKILESYRNGISISKISDKGTRTFRAKKSRD